MNAPNTALELIRQAALHALKAADVLVPEWLPEGRRQGREWVALNPARGDRHAGSFGVSLDTGRWHDFADSNARGGDLVSLLAYLRGSRQVEAAQEIDQRLSLGLFNSSATVSAETCEQRRLAAERERTEALQREQLALEAKQRDAAHQAAQLWRLAKPADAAHPYLLAKAVPPYRLRQLRQGRLLIPLLQGGQLVNLQIIDPTGAKRFLSGGKVKGCYSPIGSLGDVAQGGRLYLCEGWATGATLHASTRRPVICAMNAGNLKPVAIALREHYGERMDLVIAGDDDRLTLGNPGHRMANQAASAANARVVFPDWPCGAPEHLTDFNDLYQWLSSQQKGSRAQ